MRTFITGAVAATVFTAACGPTFAFDPSVGQSWQRSRPPAAVAYFKLPLHAAKADDKVVYGLALTAPMLRSYDASPVLIADTPKLLDLRFNGAVPDTLRVTGQVAWALNPSNQPDAQRLNLLGRLAGLVLGVAGTAAGAYGIYALLKKKCSAISTTTGACVKTGS